ncbi:MAG: thioredoxin family protein [Bacillota bacterium]|jgi:small redox-active disulfide protein 2
MKIEVLGTGCTKCRKTEETIKEVIGKLGVDAEVVHVTDLNQILDRGVMMTPAVFIDGRKVIEGRVPGRQQIEKWFQK